MHHFDEDGEGVEEADFTYVPSGTPSSIDITVFNVDSKTSGISLFT